MSELKFPGRAGSPRILLQTVADNEGDRFEHAALVFMTKDGDFETYATKGDPAFFALAQVHFAELVRSQVFGHVEEE